VLAISLFSNYVLRPQMIPLSCNANC
jgi:hypothetical protein